MHPAEHTVLGDRIEAGTFLIAGAVTGGEVEVTGISPHVLDLFLSKLRSIGVQHPGEHAQHQGERRPRTPTGRCDVATLPYPGLSDRSAGADHGAALYREGCLGGHRERLREPVRLRGRVDPSGGGDPGRRQPRRRHGRAGADGSDRALSRPARRRRAGHGRTGRPRAAPNCATSITSTAATSGSRRSCRLWAPRWSGQAPRGLRDRLRIRGQRGRISLSLQGGPP